MNRPNPFNRRRFLATTGLATAGLFITRNALSQCEVTTPDILGPFHVPGAPFRTVLASADEPGTRLFIDGQIFGNDCETPLADTVVDVWHATENGCYSVSEICPDEDPFNCRGQMITDADGQFSFETILPGWYLNGASFRPRHLHMIIVPPGDSALTTQIYFEGDPYIDDDHWASDPAAAARIIPLMDEGEAKRGFLPLYMDVDMLTAAPDDPHSLPSSVALMPNYPNPFNPRTTIRYQIRMDTTVHLAVYTLDGKLVRELVNGHRTAGFHSADWDGRNDAGREMPSGVYLSRMLAGGYQGVQKMHLVR